MRKQNLVQQGMADVGVDLLRTGLKEGAAHLSGANHDCVSNTIQNVASGAAGLAGTYAAGHLTACHGCAGAVVAAKAGSVGTAVAALALAHPVVATAVVVGGALLLVGCLFEAGEKIG